jgi:hypothetical protein
MVNAYKYYRWQRSTISRESGSTAFQPFSIFYRSSFNKDANYPKKKKAIEVKAAI